MSIIRIEISDKLAKKLRPYQDRLIELLELGLQKVQEREQDEHQSQQQEQLFQILATSDKVTLPKPYTGEKPYVRQTPVPITGKPISEILIEQRGPL